MSTDPNRCQHLKTNGTQCGSPALRSNRFCYFHKRYQDERIRLNADRRRRGTATFFLPVLEDANFIQMSLMQIMRLLLTGQIEHKTASLLLHALQTASTNLRLTKFDPRVHEVILDPHDSRNSPLDTNELWDDEDFEEEEEEEVDEVEREIEEKCEEAARKARDVARWEAKKEIEARQRAIKRYEDDEKLKVYVQQHPEYMLVREDGRLKVVQSPQPEAAQSAKPAHEQPEKKPAASASAAEVRQEITGMIREKLPELTNAYNKALEKEAEKQSIKKEPQKETLSTEVKKNAT